jgi:crotonobetainyl-CoA:carnitine CoA-transferase CaiB-like acyl-CoA transferase
MLDTQIAWLTYQAASYFVSGQPPERLGRAHPNLVPYEAFKCLDGRFINVAVGSERIWKRFCQGIEREDLLNRPEFANNGLRVKNRAALTPLLQTHFLKRRVNEWVDALQIVNVPCGAINDLAAVFSDPQVLSRQMLVETAHPTLGAIKQTGIPIKFSISPGSLDRHPPLLGEHNREILGTLGFSDSEMKLMAENLVI